MTRWEVPAYIQVEAETREQAEEMIGAALEAALEDIVAINENGDPLTVRIETLPAFEIPER